MTQTDAPLDRVHITADALRDGSLIAAARLRSAGDPSLLSDAQIAASLHAMLASHPPDEDVWLFGYGSLMWNPAMHYAETRPGLVRGWHRSYCLWAHMGRGTPDSPGLMLALDRGGSSVGLLFRFPAATARTELLLPWRREMFTGGYLARWVRVDTDTGPIRAATFVANPAHPRYAGRLPEATIAARLAVAAGSLGTCEEYLTHTLAVLHAHGRTDHRLERLARMVTAIHSSSP
ncbi:MAG TPA: gamma-glutamylcyclotransferase [Streptosporangiaceae bacterium]|nr:gamma-glutamylcyclotransferase [Streptosporangiaceae bacterium]